MNRVNSNTKKIAKSRKISYNKTKINYKRRLTWMKKVF